MIQSATLRKEGRCFIAETRKSQGHDDGGGILVALGEQQEQDQHQQNIPVVHARQQLIQKG